MSEDLPRVPDDPNHPIDHLENPDCPRSPTVAECIRNTPAHGTTVLACPECGNVVAQVYERPEPGTAAWDAWSEWLAHHADEQAEAVLDRREDNAEPVANLLRLTAANLEKRQEPRDYNLLDLAMDAAAEDYAEGYGAKPSAEVQRRAYELLEKAAERADHDHAQELRGANR